MKKILLLLSVLAICIFVTSAQSLSLTYDGEEIGNGGEIPVLEEPNPSTQVEIVAEIVVHNNGTEEISVKVACQELVILEHTMHQFCWALSCFPPGTTLSSNSLAIPAGGSSEGEEGFSGHCYVSDGVQGVTRIMYTFFDENNVNDSIAVYVNYISGYLGLAEEIGDKIHLSEAYPNPAKGITSFDYELDHGLDEVSFVVSNLLGIVHFEQKLTDAKGTLRFDATTWNKGIYFCTVLVNNEAITTRKMILN